MQKLSAAEFIEKGNGIITLCGSTRFFFEAMECNKLLTFNGWMVFQCGSWGHSFDKYTDQHTNRDYSMVKKLHFRKIQESSAIVVVSDKSEYIGESTKAEIAFAEFQSIPVFYFDGLEFSGECYSDSIPDLSKFSDAAIDKFVAAGNPLGFE